MISTWEMQLRFSLPTQGREYLITNWHVLSGRDAKTRQPLHPSAAIPNFLRVAHHVSGKTGQWMFFPHPLYREDGSSVWLQHPRGSEIDVAALPMSERPDWSQSYPLDFAELARTDMLLYPSLPVSIVGFPFGLRLNGLFPLWKTGHIAPQTDLLTGGTLPCYLIDATTREGMSGRRWWPLQQVPS
jgi:hypothetical protein